MPQETLTQKEIQIGFKNISPEIMQNLHDLN